MQIEKTNLRRFQIDEYSVMFAITIFMLPLCFRIKIIFELLAVIQKIFIYRYNVYN